MVTYADLFQYSLVIIGIVGLFLMYLGNNKKRKTDNMGLFEFSLESMNNYGMIFDGVWLDLHHSEENEHNVETEYEQKFAAKGQPIYKLIANFK